MKKRQVLVSITPEHVDVVRFDRGNRGRSKRIDVTLPNEAGDWVEALQRTTKAVRHAVESLGVEGAAATVLYRSPTQAVDLSRFRTKGREAREAARLECVDALPYDEPQAVCHAVVAGRDAGRNGVCHVVAAAEREDVAAAVADFVNDASMRYQSATPVDAVTMARLVGLVLRRGGDDRGWLYVGEHTSFFLVTQDGQLVFARQIGLGVASLSAALTRPIKRRDADPIELDADTARRLLRDHGIPGRDDDIDAERGLKGFDITPLMQPVLQRMVVELRQSVRFGLTDEQRPRLTIVLKGPGATIPDLDRLLADELGVSVERDDRVKTYDWRKPGSRGSELAEAAKERRTLGRLSLLPHALAEARHVRHLKRWLWTGTAMAVLVTAADWFHQTRVLAETRRKADAVETQASEQSALQATNTLLASVINAMDDLERTIDSEVGRKTDYRAVLHELDRLAPGSVRIQVLRINRSHGQPTGHVVAFAFDGAGSGRAEVSTFVTRLRESPLFAEVEMGAMSAGHVGGLTGHRTNIDFELVEPPVAATPIATASAEEATP